MFYNIKILSDYSKTGQIIIPRSLYNKYSFCDDSAILHAGLRNTRVLVGVMESEHQDVLYISKDVIDTLLLPKRLVCQLRIQDGAVYLGPVIGLLFSKTEFRINNRKLYRSLEFTSIFKPIRGLICLFSWDKINFNNLSIEGYYLNFQSPKGEATWIRGIFPLPEVIFRRGEIGRAEEKILKDVTGNRTFNSYYFNKWDFWRVSSASENLKPHIPDTRLLNSLSDLDFMLEKNGDVFLKQAHGNKARGLVKVMKDINYFFLTNENPLPVEIELRAGAENYIHHLMKERPYLIQQAINSLELDERVVDFRVVVQKDKSLSWKCTAAIAKVGKQKGICSNFTEEGYALGFEEALSKTTCLSEGEILNKRIELESICLEVCRELDKMDENFGDVAIDAALDRELNVWILEINKEHDYNILLSIYDKEKYMNCKSNPLRYALGLSGFKFLPFNVRRIYNAPGEHCSTVLRRKFWIGKIIKG